MGEGAWLGVVRRPWPWFHPLECRFLLHQMHMRRLVGKTRYHGVENQYRSMPGWVGEHLCIRNQSCFTPADFHLVRTWLWFRCVDPPGIKIILFQINISLILIRTSSIQNSFLKLDFVWVSVDFYLFYFIILSVQLIFYRYKVSKCKIFMIFWKVQAIIEASDSISDGARGLVRKRGDNTMRELFFHLNKKFGEIIKKSWQYMLNFIPHIFSPINFCVRILVFL